MEFVYYLLLNIFIFIIYGGACLLSLIFTVSLDTYNLLDEKLNLEIFPNPVITPMDTQINFLSRWLIKYHTIVGSLLALSSLLALRSMFILINYSASQ